MSPFHLPSSLRAAPKVGKPSAQEPQQTPSLGEFELHVASVRAGTAPSAVTKFVEIPLDGPQKHVPLYIVIPKSTLTTSTVMEHDSDDDDDDTKKSISLSPRSTKFGRYEEMFSPSSEAASNEKIAVSSMEEQTLARLLFIYGFLFPPFWVMGALIRFMKLHPEPEAECGMSMDEQKERLTRHREIELKWSNYSSMALLGLLLLVSFIVVIYLGATNKWQGF